MIYLGRFLLGLCTNFFILLLRFFEGVYIITTHQVFNTSMHPCKSIELTSIAYC